MPPPQPRIIRITKAATNAKYARLLQSTVLLLWGSCHAGPGPEFSKLLDVSRPHAHACGAGLGQKPPCLLGRRRLPVIGRGSEGRASGFARRLRKSLAMNGQGSEAS